MTFTANERSYSYKFTHAHIIDYHDQCEVMRGKKRAFDPHCGKCVQSEGGSEFSDHEFSEQEVSESASSVSNENMESGPPDEHRHLVVTKRFAGCRCVSYHSKECVKERLTCQLCGKILKHPNYFKSHMAIHTNEKPFKCSICSKAFANGGTLWYHKQSHKKSSHGDT